MPLLEAKSWKRLPSLYGPTTTEAVANPDVPVAAAILTTCATPGASTGVTCTIPFPSDTAELRAVVSTGAAAQDPRSAQAPSHAYAV